MRAAQVALAWGLLGAASVAGLRPSAEKKVGSAAHGQGSSASRGGSASHGNLPSQFKDSRLRILADLQDGRQAKTPEEDLGYDCEALPHMCEAPFHCNRWTHQDTMDIRMNGLATPDGHANLRSWCMPGLESYASTLVKECVVNRNLVKSARSTFQHSWTAWSDELDASYCFAEGHCSFSMPTNTTLHDMERMCDHRFGGRRGWTRNFLSSLKRLMEMPGVFASLVSAHDGMRTQRVTRVLSKMACAQGIFHCDVQYCKNTYCRDEYYVKKYNHLLPKIKGDLIQDPDFRKEDLTPRGKRRHFSHL